MSAGRPRKCWTAAQVQALGVRTDVPTAYDILTGLGRDEAYRSVKRGAFPVPVLKIGRHLVVPTAPILELLRLAPQANAAGPAPPDPATTTRTASAPSPHEDTKATHEHTSGRTI
jgi:hypothetical protein